MNNQNFGMKVTVIFKKDSIYSDSPPQTKRMIYHNITSIHYNYRNGNGDKEINLALESDIHKTGFLLSMDNDVEEFFTSIETEIAETV
jgi:hypothetical protein